MLFLTRKRNQSIIIAGNIEVTVIDINKGEVRIGVKAPREITVDREIHERKLKEAHN